MLCNSVKLYLFLPTFQEFFDWTFELNVAAIHLIFCISFTKQRFQIPSARLLFLKIIFLYEGFQPENYEPYESFTIKLELAKDFVSIGIEVFR